MSWGSTPTLPSRSVSSAREWPPPRALWSTQTGQATASSGILPASCASSALSRWWTSSTSGRMGRPGVAVTTARACGPGAPAAMR
ncbi:hypothetical protein Celaphus_00010344 [Cervus elaphus hippelaphus]|uniref:Uncharacterized protein n=1 Tax=Cervus elaphus hippelaphus TaxID=46360 RepID=A0A212C943_CEREH|nr:hypothetical protein Celaphus_00010344 [Cervus elaphus hippelaphus]